jgi:hypothetical protein
MESYYLVLMENTGFEVLLEASLVVHRGLVPLPVTPARTVYHQLLQRHWNKMSEYLKLTA